MTCRYWPKNHQNFKIVNKKPQTRDWLVCMPLASYGMLRVFSCSASRSDMNAIRVSGTSRLGRPWDQWRSTSFRNETASPKLMLKTYSSCPDGCSDECRAFWAKEHMSAWNLGIHPTKRWAALCWLGCTKTCCTLGCLRSHCTGHVVHMLGRSGVFGTHACSKTNRTPADRQASANKSAANSKALAISTCRSSAVVRPSMHHGASAWRATLEPGELPMSVGILALLAVHVSLGGVSKTPAKDHKSTCSQICWNFLSSSMSYWLDGSKSINSTRTSRPRERPCCTACFKKKPSCRHPEKRWASTTVWGQTALVSVGQTSSVRKSVACCSCICLTTWYVAKVCDDQAGQGRTDADADKLWPGTRTWKSKRQSNPPVMASQVAEAEAKGRPEGTDARAIHSETQVSKCKQHWRRDRTGSKSSCEHTKATTPRRRKASQGWRRRVATVADKSRAWTEVQTWRSQGMTPSSGVSKPVQRPSVTKVRQTGGRNGPGTRKGGQRNFLRRTCFRMSRCSWAYAWSKAETSSEVNGWTVCTKRIRHPVWRCFKWWMRLSRLAFCVKQALHKEVMANRRARLRILCTW